MADKQQRLDAAAERRSTRRFAIEQEVIYKILDHRAAVPESGVGKTLDISSGGVLFETQQRLRPGKRVEVSVNWPALLDGGCPLKFVAVGRVVRAEEKRAAMHIEQHEFRTRRTKEMPAAEIEKLVSPAYRTVRAGS
jgi:PilZ domain